jgi:dTDP-4-amino-4,6-dideoxygalactose transaminase
LPKSVDAPTILMNDFKSEPRALRDAMLTAAERVFASGWYVLGKEVEQFEKRWADACGARYAVGVGNGMDALEIALRLLGIGPGDEVITTPMTAFASVLAIIRAGATPVLADIDPDTALLSAKSVQRCISKKTRALLVVHLYGQLRNIEEWVAICADNRFELIEDCAQSHLASSGGKIAGTFGRIGAYSFYPTKNLGAMGDAGALITDAKDLAERTRQFRNYGQSQRYHHPNLGMNSRLDELQAAILSERLKWLDEFTHRRRAIAERFFREIRNDDVATLARPTEPSSHVYHLFVVKSSARDKLQAHLAERGIQSLIHYPVPVHHQEPCRDLQRDPKGLKVSERHAETCLSIPCHPQMSDGDAERVIDALNSFRAA